MTKNDIDVKRCIANSIDRYRIGTDARGRAHFYHPVHAVIWVMADDSTLEVAYRSRDLGAWRDYVAEECGWVRHSISDVSTPELAASALAEAAQ